MFQIFFLNSDFLSKIFTVVRLGIHTGISSQTPQKIYLGIYPKALLKTATVMSPAITSGIHPGNPYKHAYRDSSGSSRVICPRKKSLSIYTENTSRILTTESKISSATFPWNVKSNLIENFIIDCLDSSSFFFSENPIMFSLRSLLYKISQ